jgi:hypothetical protein
MSGVTMFVQWEKRAGLAAGTSSDHQVVLAAFEVGALSQNL